MKAAVSAGRISGGGEFTRRCEQFFEGRYGFAKVLLTTSGTDALEMAALLLGMGPSDEVILPSFTFVSTANAFALRGARLVFADSSPLNPNVDPESIEASITPRTRVIVPVHYAGIACDMDRIHRLSERHDLFVVEDAAHAIDSCHRGRPLGSLGHVAAFSFHETKNVTSGEGGMLVVSDEKFSVRAEIIREKGTNRAAFYRGEVNKYSWMDLGSSFLPSDMIAAFLWGQLENLDRIQKRRVAIWRTYRDGLELLEHRGCIQLLRIPPYATNNAHMFFLLCGSYTERDRLIRFLGDRGVMAVFHYLPLHKSPFFEKLHDGRPLPLAEMYAERLLRLPLYYELEESQQARVIDAIRKFYGCS
jgi:dTDP-4-amino-4,6-dideoxygalactose transaminase